KVGQRCPKTGLFDVHRCRKRLKVVSSGKKIHPFYRNRVFSVESLHKKNGHFDLEVAIFTAN
ncbi:MAG TPA: hypothetical protein DCL08_02765, partial [Anaerolineaceae bacterium]|nr:hypothetical protein [Anaerolineaceae bacterium]